MDILNTLQALNACHGPSGDESGVAAFLEKLAAPYVDECRTDTMGNLIAHRKGSGSRVMFAAHMDSIGCMVTHIEKEGFVRFGKVGGLETASLLHTPVRFKNGARGLISLDEKVKLSDMKLDDLYLDIGAKSAEEARAMVQVGDTAVFDTQAFAAGSRLVSPYLDNRISCLALLMAMEQCSARNNDLYFVFTTQEEVGLRGAKTAAFAIDPDYAVVVDVTVAGDELGSKHEGSSVLGGGAAIKVMDSSVICHPQMVKKMDELARAADILAQMDVLSAGGTDGGSIHTTRMGVVTGGVSVPCRYIHTPTEMVDRNDVEACASLLAALAETRL